MKKEIFGIGLCLTLLLSGCTQRGSVSPKSTSTTLPDPKSSLSQSGENTVPTTTVKQVDWSSQVKGKILGMYPAGDNKILVFADQIILYDLANEKTIGTMPKEALERIRCWTVDSGYVIAGHAGAEGSGSGAGFVEGGSGSQFRIIFYDAGLKVKSQFDLSKLLNDEDDLISTQSLAFSSDGNRIAYATMTGLYIYDQKQDKRTTLIDLTSEDEKARSGISIVEQVGFANDGKSIAFKAQSLDVPAIPGKSSFDTTGIISADGSGLTNQKIEGYSVKELSTYDSKLLIAEDFRTATGRLMVMDSNNRKRNILDLSDKKEGGNIYGSDTGQYFASSVPSKDGWMVRVYNTETGKLVKEKNISNDGQELYGINDPMLLVLDKTKICFVLLGNKQDKVDTKVESFSF